MIQQGLLLAVLGMAIVFGFLTLLVVVIRIVGWTDGLVGRIPAGSASQHRTTAAAAAVAYHRKRTRR